MPKKPSKMAPWQIDAALQQAETVERARELIAAAGHRAPHLMVHALENAASAGETELVKLFLEHEVELDEPDALVNAAGSGHAEIVTLLVDAGADPDAGKLGFSDDAPDGKLALFAAIRGGHAGVVEALIAGGADVNKVSFANRTPLDAARAYKAEPIVALLEAAGAKGVSNDMLDLEAAVEENAVERVALLAKREKREVLAAALETACRSEDREACVIAILKYGKKKLEPVDLVDGLCAAAKSGQQAAIQLLVEAGTPIDGRNKTGQPAMYEAADYASLRGIDALLAAGASIDATSYNGKTALHVAAQRQSNGKVIEKLLAAGADPTRRNDNKETPIDLAKSHDNEVAIEILSKLTPQRSRADVTKSLDKKLKKHLRTTAIPVFAKKATETATGSRFGGRPGLRANETWPVCEECDSALAFFFQLDTSTLPKEHALHTSKKTAAIVQLFFCTDCEGTSLARSLPAGKVTTIATAPKKPKPFAARVIERWTTHDDYPSEKDLDNLDVDERKALDRTLAGTKVGGWPKWLQDPAYAKAGKTKLDQLVAQLDVNGPLPYEFGDSGIGFVFADRKRAKLGFVWQCL